MAQSTRDGLAASGVGAQSSALARFLLRGKPLRRLPVFARYTIATAIVVTAFAARYALGDTYPYPYLIFVLAVILSSFILDRGSGFLATALSALLVVYFFVEPRNSFDLIGLGEVLALILFVTVGLLAASVIEALRVAVEELTVTTQDLATSRQELGTSLGILETIFECSPDPICVTDQEGRFQRVNAAAARFMAASPEAMIGKRARDFLPEEQASKLEQLNWKVLETRRPITVEERLAAKGSDQAERWFMATKAPWHGPDGSLSGVIEITRDIHDRKEMEEALQGANAQKDILLHDINHRVKNHLQSIISTLSMSAREMEEGQGHEAIQAAISRLAVLARVYDRLRLREEGQAVVNARDFVIGLCSDLQAALIDLRPIALNARAEPMPLELGRAVPVGLIVNEAITNAVKYGFPDDAPGHVAVLFERRGDRLHLEISDTGIGMATERRGSGVGTRLIRALAQQLDGTAQWQGPPGTTLVVSFPASTTEAPSGE